MKRLLVILLLSFATACGGASPKSEAAANRAGDVAFLTELMHRDAALLNLLDVSLGRPFDPEVVTATEQLRRDAIERIEASADQLESWDEEVPKTVRDHAFEHSSDDHAIPSLEGMPSGGDLQALARVPRARFEVAFVDLLGTTLDATRDLAAGMDANAEQVAALARDATRSCERAVAALRAGP